MRAALLTLLLLLPSPVVADDYMPTTTRGLEIEEWNRFLAANPLHYNVMPFIVPLTDELKALTKRVNVEVNRNPYRADTVEDWRLLADGEAGDCEDYVLTKRDRLIRAGIPAGALLPAWIEAPDDPEAHLVLVLLTDKGDFVMDNMTDWIEPWEQARMSKAYRYTYRLYGGTTWQIVADR